MIIYNNNSILTDICIFRVTYILFLVFIFKKPLTSISEGLTECLTVNKLIKCIYFIKIQFCANVYSAILTTFIYIIYQNNIPFP